MQDPRTTIQAHPTERSGATPITSVDPDHHDSVTFSEKETVVIVGEDETVIITETTTIEVISND